MAAPKVFVTRKIHEEGLALLRERYTVDIWDSEEPMPKDELKEKAKTYDAILCMISDTIDKEVLQNAGPQLKTIATMSVGTHHINVQECNKRGIFVSNTPNVCSDTAAEMTVLLLLVTARRCMEGHQAVLNGEWGLWKPMWICGIEISKRTLGILGFGRVGFGVARRLKPFGVSRILYNDVHSASMGDDIDCEFVDKETLYKESDFLVITCPLNGQTHKMINKKVFDMMKRGSVLVNSSRGSIVNTDDLVEALKSGKLAGAGLDVTDPQPLPPDHPLVKMDNCVITPHLGTNSVQARKAMALNAAEHVIGILKK